MAGVGSGAWTWAEPVTALGCVRGAAMNAVDLARAKVDGIEKAMLTAPELIEELRPLRQEAIDRAELLD